MRKSALFLVDLRNNANQRKGADVASKITSKKKSVQATELDHKELGSTFQAGDPSIASDNIKLDDIRKVMDKSKEIISRLREHVFQPNTDKRLKRRFSITEAAEMVGRTATAIREAEKSGRLPAPTLDEKKRRVGYSLEDINRMRDEFGTRPWRSPTDEPITIAIQNFKGGVGKSTITCHIAQYLALAGYRVCVIDCDSQASTTTVFGLNPDLDLDHRGKDTIFSYLVHGGQPSLDYALRDTYWDGIKLIPANLALYNAEYELASKVNGNPDIFNRLRYGIDTIKDRFDVILIDPPPALGMISLSVLRAANALLIPVPPATVDFSSTAHFFSMLYESLDLLNDYGIQTSYKFLKVLASKVNDNKSAHIEISKMMKSVYAENMLEAQIKDSAEIDNANARLMTVYELEKPQSSRDTYNRCLAYLNAVNREVELLIRKTWPSHHNALRQEGLI